MKCEGIRNGKTKFSYPFHISCTILTFFVPSPTFEYFNLLILTHLPLQIVSLRNMSLEQEPLGSIGVLAPLESNFEIDSTSHYRESAAL